MIFVTVGTHEQQFDRLIKEIDRLKKDNVIEEEVFMQTGYSSYVPKYCAYEKILTFNKMEYYLKEARIVITHGGPASFMKVLEKKKVPIVVPRKIEYSEHVNNHQTDFIIKLNEKNKRVIVVDDIESLENSILNYDILCQDILTENSTNNLHFVNQLSEIVSELFSAK